MIRGWTGGLVASVTPVCCVRKVLRRRGWVIRWWEVEIAPDGIRQKALRYERLGPMSRKQAAEILSQRTAAAGNARAVRSRVAFRTLVAEWEQSILPMYKPSTQKHRRFMLKKHLRPEFGDRAVCESGRQDTKDLSLA